MHTKRWVFFILTGAITLSFAFAAMAAEKKPNNKGPVSVRIQAPVEKVKSALVAFLTTQGFEVESEGRYRMVFSKDTEGMMAEFAARMMLGGNYRDKPRFLAHFTFVEDKSGTEVIGRQEITTRNNFGATNRESLDSGKWRRTLVQYLNAVKFDAEEENNQDPLPSSH